MTTVSTLMAGPPPRSAASGARIALILLLTINFFNYVDRQVLASVEPLIEPTFFSAQEYDRNDPDVRASVGFSMGLLNTAFLVSYMLLAPVFGWLGDRWPRWILIGIGVILWSLASGASGLATSYGKLLVTRCFVGVGEAAYGPIAPTVIADLFATEKRGSKLAWFYLAIPIGSACGYVLGAAIIQFTGGWRWAFYVVVLPGILLGLWAMFMREPTRGQADAAVVTRKTTSRDYMSFLRTPSYILNTIGMTAMTFAMGGIAFWMPRYVSIERQAGDLAEVNLTFGVIVVLAGLLGTLSGGWLGDRLRPRFPGSYFLVSGVAMILGMPLVLLVLYTPFPLAWMWLFLACFCLFFNTGPTNTVLANVTHPAVRSSAFAFNIFILHAFGDAISPPILGWVNNYYKTMNVGFEAISVMFLIGGLAWLWGAKYLARDTALAPTRIV